MEEKYRTLSTTGKPVNNFYFCRQHSLTEPVFRLLFFIAQERARDQYVRADELKWSYIEKKLPEQRLATKNAIHNAPPQRTVAQRLPASFHGSHVNSKRKQLDAMAVVARMGPPTLMVTFPGSHTWPEVLQKPPSWSNRYGQT